MRVQKHSEHARHFKRATKTKNERTEILLLRVRGNCNKIPLTRSRVQSYLYVNGNLILRSEAFFSRARTLDGQSLGVDITLAENTIWR